MNRKRWQRIQESFDRAIELRPPARREFLERLEIEDADLHRSVVALLRSADAAGDFIEQAIDGVAGQVVERRDRPPDCGEEG